MEIKNLKELMDEINKLVPSLNCTNTDIIKLSKLVILSQELKSIIGLQYECLNRTSQTSERLNNSYKEILIQINKV